MTEAPKTYFDELLDKASAARKALGDPPPICPHQYPTECGPECTEINEKFDAWVRRALKDEA